MEEVRLRARRAATALDALGVREGDAVGLLLRNDYAFLEASLAAVHLGAYVLPFNWHLTAGEISYILSDAAPRVLVAHADLLAAVRHVIPRHLDVVAVPVGAGLRETSRLAVVDVAPSDVVWDAWCDAHAPWDAPPRPLHGTMIYTSGTTGRPKGVRREAATLAQQAANRALFSAVYGVEDGMRAYIGGPLYHASPNAFARMAVNIGELLATDSRFDAERTLTMIESERITHMVMVPAMFVRLLKLPSEIRGRYDVSSLRWVTHTGAPCPAEVKRAVIDWWGPVLHETYGGTETGAAVHCDSAEWLAHPGTVGRAMPGTTMRVLDDDGREVPAGTPGEVYMRCAAYADFTYHNRPDERQKVERDGLVTSGDVGYVDADGFLFLCDRKRDMIIVGGVNIYPAEIESVLVQHPGVRDCAVFGIPDDELGESVMAVVEPAGPGVTVDDILRYLDGRLARQKHPRRVEFQDALPREESGKLFKRKLRDPYWAGREKAI